MYRLSSIKFLDAAAICAHRDMAAAMATFTSFKPLSQIDKSYWSLRETNWSYIRNQGFSAPLN